VITEIRPQRSVFYRDYDHNLIKLGIVEEENGSGLLKSGDREEWLFRARDSTWFVMQLLKFTMTNTQKSRRKGSYLLGVASIPFNRLLCDYLLSLAVYVACFLLF
jgi:hypothetical protein